MKKERAEIGLGYIQLNEGQLPWLPKNPRTWTQTDIDRTAASIKEDPDFLEDRPLLVVSLRDTPYFVVFAGNLRHEGALAAKRNEVPCVVYCPKTEEDYETIRRRAMKDNGSFGAWDYDALANEWGDLPLTDWGVPAWDGDTTQDEMPTDFDAAPKNAPFVCKITFPDADAMTRFVTTYKDMLEEEFPGITLAESGGEL